MFLLSCPFSENYDHNRMEPVSRTSCLQSTAKEEVSQRDRMNARILECEHFQQNLLMQEPASELSREPNGSSCFLRQFGLIVLEEVEGDARRQIVPIGLVVLE